jgi:hypothetical protein
MHRRHIHNQRQGFTLLEMLISVSLGMALVYTALAGFRVLTQAITTSKQMSTENGLLRAGMQQALDEVDFWTTSDDPFDASRQPMRVGGAATAGMPFTPFRSVVDPITGGRFIDGQARLDERAAQPRGGWNPNPLAWAAWDQRAWTRANLAEEFSLSERGYQYWGTFGIYENLDPAASWHHWFGGQVLGLVNALGFYGALDYLPSNSFLVYHGTQIPLGAPDASISWGGVPKSMIQNGTWLCAQDGGDNIMHARIRNSNGSRYFLPGPELATATLCRKLGKIGYNGRDNSYDVKVVKDFLRDSGVFQQAIPYRPEAWPDVTCEVRRLIEYGHQLTACAISSFHPLTGSRTTIPFAVVGTTLRGARQQRLPTLGWADPFAGPTLDYDNPP